ncbi:MAG: DUF1178 family protein [Burkholderiales bacterium]
MIVFDLRCALGHAFEGWFDSADAFDGQKARGLVSCPTCDSAEVSRVPSAKVSVSRGRETATTPTPAPTAQSGHEVVAGLPAEVVAKLREIVRATEDVGTRFPEEARRIHYQEAPQRAIRGRASAEEAARLVDEGIEFAPLPAILTRDEH